MRKSNLITGVLWLGLAIFIFFESFHLGLGKFNFPGPGLFPFLTAVPLGLLAILLVLEQPARKGRGEKETGRVWAADTNWRKIVFTLLALVAYVILLRHAGYLLATLLLMLFLFKSIEPQRWPVAVLASLATVVASYLLFALWLQCQFPEGILEKMIRGVLV